jgi:urea carboxylase-associated protein 2
MTALDQATPEEFRRRYEELQAGARAASPRLAQAALEPSNPTRLKPKKVLHREIVPGGWYWSAIVPRGRTLRIVNGGTGSVSALFWNAEDTSERYNAGDTVKIQWHARLSTGRVLFSDMGRVLMSITGDTAGGRHDFIAGGSTPLSNRRRYGDAGLRNSRDNFRLAVGKYGMGVRDVPPCVTFFAGVTTGADGRFAWIGGHDRAGDHVDLRAEMNVLAVLSNCPHPLDPSPVWAPRPIEAIVWRSPEPDDDDLCRTATVEAARGFENTDPPFAAGREQGA